MTIEQICERAPRLRTLLDEVRQQEPTEEFCNQYWHRYERFKQELHRCVGWRVRAPEINTTEAYNTAHRELMRLMPDCSDCE